MELCRCLISTFVDILWERCPSLHARRRAPVCTRYADRLNSDNKSAVRNVPPRRTGSPARPGRQSSAYVAAAPGRRHDHHAAVSPSVHPTLPAITNLSHLPPEKSRFFHAVAAGNSKRYSRPSAISIASRYTRRMLVSRPGERAIVSLVKVK